MSAAGARRTVARSVARFTSALSTPVTPRSADSTETTHDAQVIPLMARSLFSSLWTAVVLSGRRVASRRQALPHDAIVRGAADPHGLGTQIDGGRLDALDRLERLLDRPDTAFTVDRRHGVRPFGAVLIHGSSLEHGTTAGTPPGALRARGTACAAAQDAGRVGALDTPDLRVERGVPPAPQPHLARA